jgi:hypothetical protein
MTCTERPTTSASRGGRSRGCSRGSRVRLHVTTGGRRLRGSLSLLPVMSGPTNRTVWGPEAQRPSSSHPVVQTILLVGPCEPPSTSAPCLLSSDVVHQCPQVRQLGTAPRASPPRRCHRRPGCTSGDVVRQVTDQESVEFVQARAVGACHKHLDQQSVRSVDDRLDDAAARLRGVDRRAIAAIIVALVITGLVQVLSALSGSGA